MMAVNSKITSNLTLISNELLKESTRNTLYQFEPVIFCGACFCLLVNIKPYIYRDSL